MAKRSKQTACPAGPPDAAGDAQGKAGEGQPEASQPDVGKTGCQQLRRAAQRLVRAHLHIEQGRRDYAEACQTLMGAILAGQLKTPLVVGDYVIARGSHARLYIQEASVLGGQ